MRVVYCARPLCKIMDMHFRDDDGALTALSIHILELRSDPILPKGFLLVD